ncbi:CheR family methyltransferase [Marinobacterium arenosum]|uniref:CheR family methyltransferase n=1 Tax=Marinobacterium arenosum TaxID=2862496 RepID=UPI001C9893BF|nr:protein-glutamate O-methyltransferase CheR [Marinobacterium arenosum]MBY4677720.1 protein-glutamate O-methyltransferase CheR [Marinobacterium arenosum]
MADDLLLPDCFDPADEPPHSELNAIEIELLLEAVMRRYGYDFRQYSAKVLHRRLNIFRSRYRARHLSELIPALLHDPDCMQQLLLTLSVTVTEFFRDPAFFAAFRQEVVPILRTYPFISLWCAGCATGEEAYSWAILLQEAGLLERSRIYATDINSRALEEAREGVYGEPQYQIACQNYQQMGGPDRFDRYCRRSYNAIKMSGALQDHITFASHNLVHDGVFGEMVVVSCRNVMIYFNQALKQRCMDLFFNSLTSQGFLLLGESEAVDFSSFSRSFSSCDRRSRIYQKRVVPSDDRNSSSSNFEQGEHQ